MTMGIKSEHGITITKRRTSEDLLNDLGPYSSLLRDLVNRAKLSGASDIHIEPNEKGVEFRIRVDGNMIRHKTIGLEHRESLILETKRIFGLSIGVSGKPQDGRASLTNLRLDLRVSLLPTHFGEKIVMRLLNLDASFELSELGFLDGEQCMLASALQFENGVVVISGPTGSGKTRTLYALLKALGPAKLNIVTLEDPIEYRIDGLNQVQVSAKLSFAAALRSVLRQDPDVILVGEVRDQETAKLCFQAAETGHLVFTTLHANGALEVIERLSGLGVERMVLESNLRISIAQRLEQKLCLHCAEPLAVSMPELALNFSDKVRVRNSLGCSNCSLGIRGRVPILEWASFRNENGAITPALIQSLKEARKARVLMGEIDWKETDHDNH